MKLRLGCIFIFAVFSMSCMGNAAVNDGSILKITSPANGDTVGESVEIKYELEKGSQGDHVHAFVDGKYQKGFKGTLKGLSKGKHEITLKVANADHDVLATSDTITVRAEY